MSENEKVNSTTPGCLHPGVKHDQKIVETKTCKHCGTSFDITDKDLEFYEKVNPVFSTQEFCHSELDSESLEKKNFNSKKDPDPDLGTGGHGNLIKYIGNGKIKYLIPSPKLCYKCREMRRFCWRNERKLYKRKCDFSGKEIVTMYSPDKPYKVYDNEVWWSDRWNALDYGKEFDFNKPFFEQFNELLHKVPLFALINSNTENAEYNNYIYSAKNCYMSYVLYYDPEDIYYSHRAYGGKNIFDGLSIYHSGNCYNSF